MKLLSRPGADAPMSRNPLPVTRVDLSLQSICGLTRLGSYLDPDHGPTRSFMFACDGGFKRI